MPWNYLLQNLLDAPWKHKKLPSTKLDHLSVQLDLVPLIPGVATTMPFNSHQSHLACAMVRNNERCNPPTSGENYIGLHWLATDFWCFRHYPGDATHQTWDFLHAKQVPFPLCFLQRPSQIPPFLPTPPSSHALMQRWLTSSHGAQRLH